MAHKKLLKLVHSLSNQRQICLVGAAIVDIVTHIQTLPQKGQDIEMQEKGMHVGGCGLNIAIAIKRLGLGSINFLPLGKGKWADIITTTMQKEGVTSCLEVEGRDNGWCLALVEPDGERTFVSVNGVENSITELGLSSVSIDEDAIIYIAGYQLIGSCGLEILNWLEKLTPTNRILIDFGPRINDISPDLLKRLLVLKPIISINRQEAIYFGLSSDVLEFVKNWHHNYGCPLILRLDSEGAFYCDGQLYAKVPAFKTRVIDTIGAGDTHAAGVLSGLSSGWELADSVLLGNAIASYVVSKDGGDCSPTIKEMLAYLENFDD